MRNQITNLRHNTDFIKIWFAGLINTFGDSFDTLAMSWLVYELTGSKFWFALNFTINAIPNLVIQPFLGVIVERYSKKLIMVISDIGRALLVFSVVILLSLGITNPYIILLFTFFMTCFETLRQPASTSLLPHILKEDNLENGVSLIQITSTLTSILGTSIAGITIAMFGTTFALGIDLMSFILSALILSTLKIDSKNEHIANLSFKKSFAEGWSAFIKHPYLVKIATIIFMMQIFLTGINIGLTPITVEIINRGPETIAFFNTIVLIGSLLGAITYPMVSKKLKSYRIFLFFGSLGSIGLSLIGIIPFVNYKVLSMSIFLLMLSFGLGVVNPCLNVSMLKSVDKDVLARVSSFMNAAVYSSMPLGSLLTTVLMLGISLPTLMSIYGTIMLIIILFFRKDAQLKEMK